MAAQNPVFRVVFGYTGVSAPDQQAMIQAASATAVAAGVSNNFTAPSGGTLVIKSVANTDGGTVYA